MEYIVISVIFILLLVSTFYLPLLMSKYSRVIICSVGLVISLLNIVFYSFLPLWQFLIVCLVLVSSSAYFLIKYLPLPEAKDDDNKKNKSILIKDTKTSISSIIREKEQEAAYFMEQTKTESVLNTKDRIHINESNTNEFKKDELY